MPRENPPIIVRHSALWDAVAAVQDHRIGILRGLGALTGGLVAGYIAHQGQRLVIDTIAEVDGFREDFYERSVEYARRGDIDNFWMPITLSSQPLEAVVALQLRNNSWRKRQNITEGVAAYGPVIKSASARPLREGLEKHLWLRSFRFGAKVDGRHVYFDITGEVHKLSPPLLPHWKPTN